jgi:hypothetical protein
MKRQAMLLVLVAVPRLFVFPLNQNLFGDAVARTWLAHLWLQHPHVVGSFAQGGFQFGSLQLYLLALAEWAWPDLLNAGRVVSLAVGIASVVPLMALTRRLFSDAAAAAAAFGFAWWGMHIQCSTTSSSEALNLLLVFVALERFSKWVDAGERSSLLMTALMLNLASATRYDSWLLIPLLALAVLSRSRSIVTALWFGASSSAFAAGFCFGNWVDLGAPLYPFTYIDDFHRAWFPSEEALWGGSSYRVLCALFWPGTAVVTLTPAVGLAGFAGLLRAWRARRARWLVLLVVVPTVLYAVRSSVFASFAPLTRFTVKEVALVLPFVWYGAEPLFAWLPKVRAPLVALVAVGCVAWAVCLGVFCFEPTGTWQNSLRPIAATSTLEPRLSKVTSWLAQHADPTEVLVVDVDPRGYDDLVVSYFSGAAFELQARRRSALFEARLKAGQLGYLVRFEQGQLDHELTLGVNQVTFRGVALEEVNGFEPPIHVYRRAPSD